MKTTLKFIGIAVLLILILLGLVQLSIFANGVIDFLFPDRVVTQTSRTIINNLQGMGQLVTVKAEVAKTSVSVSINQGILNSGYYSANHTVVGVIEAGIDFEAIDEQSVRFENDAYTLTLPPPTITSCRIEHIAQNQHSFTLLAADWDLVRQLAQHDAIVQFAHEMIERGILKMSEGETASRIDSFVSALTEKPVNVVYKEQTGDIDLPPSCQPDLPRSWKKDDSGTWRRAS